MKQVTGLFFIFLLLNSQAIFSMSLEIQELEKKQNKEAEQPIQKNTALAIHLIPAIKPGNSVYSSVRWLQKTEEMFEEIKKERKNKPTATDTKNVFFTSDFSFDNSIKGRMIFNKATSENEMITLSDSPLRAHEFRAIETKCETLIFLASVTEKDHKILKEQTSFFESLYAKHLKKPGSICLDADQLKILNELPHYMQENLTKAYGLKIK